MNPRTIPLVLAFLFASGTCVAAPLDEAIARVSELNLMVKAQNERISRLEAQLQNQGLLSLLNQVESLKADVARLRGSQEEQAYRLETADKRTKDIYLDLDERIKEVANRPLEVSADSVRLQTSKSLAVEAVASAPQSDKEIEAKAYEVAHALIKSGRYREAIVSFQEFVNQYPSGTLAANALYWIGISQVTGLSDFKAASESYQRLLKNYPYSPKVPDALLSLARAQIQLDEKEPAQATLNLLLVKHPASKAAENGKKLLATLN